MNKVEADAALTAQDWVFTRQLAEVYLLIDNVSSVVSKSIPQAPKNNPVFEAAFKQPALWLQEVCAIPWPPHLDKSERGKRASQLICARDVLNSAAAPATGATIAFSLLVLNNQVSFARGVRRLVRDARAIGSAARGLFGRGGDTPTTAELDDARRASLTIPRLEALTMASGSTAMAELAYPSLAPAARQFSRRMLLLVVFLLAWVPMTFSLSWTVASGRVFLTDYTTASADLATNSGQILAQQQPSSATTAERPTKGATTVPVTPGTALDAGAGLGNQPGLEPDAWCNWVESGAAANADALRLGAAKPNPNRAAGGSAAAASLRGLQLCADRAAAARHLGIATRNLVGWSYRQHHTVLRVLEAMATRLASLNVDESAGTRAGADLNEAWVSAWLAIAGGTVLPILYGVIGAGAAAGRMLSAKLRDSLLTPRDSLLAWIGIGLGGVVGGCIGLFITPENAQSASVLGHLSASALCFLAGFSVEGVFQMLERLTGAVFIVKTNGSSAAGHG